jgi:DNA-binding IclR family transcriptional regulator
MGSEKNTIESIDRALDILMLLLQEEKEMGVTQISTALGIYKSTICRTLTTMEKKGFVQQNPENSKYWLGLKLYSLGMLIREKMPLKNMAYPYAKELADRFKEGVHIIVLDKSAEFYPKQIIIDKIQSQQVLSLAPPIGSLSASHCSASGKCLLAFSPQEYIDKFTGNPLPIFTEKTIGDWGSLLKELEIVRAQGYALDNGELEMGLTCIAAPIFSRNQEAIAAISLSGPTSRINSTQLPDIINAVKKTAQRISALM